MLHHLALKKAPLTASFFCRRSFSSLVRRPAPEFMNKKAIINGEITTLSSSELAGSYSVILFYPLDFTFVCPTELIAFNDRLAEFESLGVKVVAASVDSEYSHLAWTKLPRDQGGLGQTKIPLIADVDKSMASNYGVLLDSGIALRGLFIVDKRGIVRQSTVNDLPIGRSVDEVLRLIQAIQFYDANGEGMVNPSSLSLVCPANWTPGKPSIVPTPSGSLKYFTQH